MQSPLFLKRLIDYLTKAEHVKNRDQLRANAHRMFWMLHPGVFFICAEL
jgi:hypothetical protein